MSDLLTKKYNFYRDYGDACFVENYYSEAIEHYNRALAICKNDDDKKSTFYTGVVFQDFMMLRVTIKV